MFRVNTNSIRVTLVGLFVIASMEGLQHATQLKLAAAPQVAAEAPKDTAAMLANARTIYVHSRTGFVKSEVIEGELQNRADFQQTGLLLTRDPKAADLAIEVRRANFTTEYPYVVVDTKTKLIVASGKVNSLFGTAAGKIATRFIKQLQLARTAVSSKPTK